MARCRSRESHWLERIQDPRIFANFPFETAEVTGFCYNLEGPSTSSTPSFRGRILNFYFYLPDGSTMSGEPAYYPVFNITIERILETPPQEGVVEIRS